MKKPITELTPLEKFIEAFDLPYRQMTGKIEYRVSDLDYEIARANKLILKEGLPLKVVCGNAGMRSFDVCVTG